MIVILFFAPTDSEKLVEILMKRIMEIVKN